ncbi:hypothetical protein BgiBS90_037209, partial [Biomphalaria glabrata]
VAGDAVRSPNAPVLALNVTTSMLSGYLTPLSLVAHFSTMYTTTVSHGLGFLHRSSPDSGFQDNFLLVMF